MPPGGRGILFSLGTGRESAERGGRGKEKGDGSFQGPCTRASLVTPFPSVCRYSLAAAPELTAERSSWRYPSPGKTRSPCPSCLKDKRETLQMETARPRPSRHILGAAKTLIRNPPPKPPTPPPFQRHRSLDVFHSEALRGGSARITTSQPRVRPSASLGRFLGFFGF